MSVIIVDLEATCWEKGSSPERMEIIEIGSVKLEGETLQSAGSFGRFVKPVSEPVLSEFCTRLTSIRQQDVDGAAGFEDVLAEWLAWMGEGVEMVASWGAYDLKQLGIDCRRHGIPLPQVLDRHVNLKTLFSRLMSCKPTGMRGALARLGLDLEGTHHRGIDDARNIARIAQLILPRCRESTSPGQST